VAGLILGSAIAGFSSAAGAQDVQAAGPNINCTCRYRGKSIKLGETVCMQTPGGSRLARCEMALNNTSWKILGGSCPLASAPSARTPRS